MKKLFFIILIVFSQNSLKSQIIPSSCEGDEETITYYTQQAARLTIRWLKGSGSPDTALTTIPEDKLYDVRDALIAVRNAVSLPGYDSIKGCHTRLPDLNNYVLLCDTTSIWAKSWSKGELLTGDEQMDTLIEKFGFEYVEYVYSNQYNGAFTEFYTDKIFNVNAVCNEFNKIPGIHMAYTYDKNAALPSVKLNFQMENNIRKLTYSYGWGDCMSGCSMWKHWNVYVYDNCSVEFIGNNPPIYTGINNYETISGVTVSPNPFYSTTTIQYELRQAGMVKLAIYNNTGSQVDMIIENQSSGKQQMVWNADKFPTGIYFYRFKSGEQIGTGKLVLMK